MKTATVKCSLPRCSDNAVVIIDTEGNEAHIPFKFLLDKKHHKVTKLVCEVTIPLWLAIDRGVKYDND